MLSAGQRVLVAVSGGLDSMVLLQVLRDLSFSHGWKLSVAHFNHQLRGARSNADERLVRGTAKRCRLRFEAGRADVKKFAHRQKLSMEMAARRLRHDFLARAARRCRAGTIVLGHHADDQVELFFLRLLRGSGGEGLAGMKWLGSSPSDPKIQLVRPLLDCSKGDLRQFACEHRIVFREDETNASLNFPRNRVRHELLPLLVAHYQPALTRITLRLMEVLGAESSFITDSARAWGRRKRPAFGRLPLALQRRSLQLQMIDLGVKADFDLVEQLRLRPALPVTIRPGWAVQRSSAGCVQLAKIVKTEFDAARLDVNLRRTPGVARFAGLKLTWRVDHYSGGLGGSRPLQTLGGAGERTGSESFDADKVGATIALRHWRPADRFQPIGMPKSVKLQDLFGNLKVPRAQRHRVVVAVAANGELFWVEGQRISDRFKLDKNTVRRLKWRWQGS